VTYGSASLTTPDSSGTSRRAWRLLVAQLAPHDTQANLDVRCGAVERLPSLDLLVMLSRKPFRAPHGEGRGRTVLIPGETRILPLRATPQRPLDARNPCIPPEVP
jgi:hypothetical protein